jgi:hypothetical protein
MPCARCARCAIASAYRRGGLHCFPVVSLGWLGRWASAGDRCRDSAPRGGGASLDMGGPRACGRGVGPSLGGAHWLRLRGLRATATACGGGGGLRVLGRRPKAAC